jgi:hypothetical protein
MAVSLYVLCVCKIIHLARAYTHIGFRVTRAQRGEYTCDAVGVIIRFQIHHGLQSGVAQLPVEVEFSAVQNHGARAK